VIVPRTFIGGPAAKTAIGLRTMNPAVTIFMLLRPCFIFDIRRFVVPVIRAI